MKTALVCGAGGFIGSHMVKRLKADGYWVRGVDLKRPEFSETEADQFMIGDLRSPIFVSSIIKFNYLQQFDLIIQLAADMGGAGYIFTGEHDADIMHNSVTINCNILDCLANMNFAGKIFYSSSACMYPHGIQTEESMGDLREEDAYPAFPDSEYGWEKIFSERLYDSYRRNYGINIRIARFHNIFGPEGTWKGNKEKAPAAICRKVAEATDQIEVWGDGRQTRSFLFVDECIDGVMRLIESDCHDPVNIGSDERVSINQLVEMVCEISGKQHIIVKHIDGPQGVRSRNSNNDFIKAKLGWAAGQPLRFGMEKLYSWIEKQVDKNSL